MRRWIIAIGLLLVLVHPAVAQEVIRRFVSDVTINTDASLDVRETITVNAEGMQIRRGIIRDFPTTYRDRNGLRVQVDFDVVAVERDGNSEPYTTSNVGNGVRLQIGNKDVFLPSGEYTYLITYRTTRQIGFFDDFDELYWNATGNGWTFPIEEAQAIIRLPTGASIRQHSVYTGPTGSTAADADVLEASGRLFIAQTTQRLEPNEGLTVAVAWQKGIVTEPSGLDRSSWWLWDNIGFFIAGLTVLATAGYYLFAWSKVGRDPPGGTIIPLFQPPEGLGPAGVRYIWKQGFDDQSFAAALVGLAVKQRVRIVDDDGDYAIERLPDQGLPLTRSEASLYAGLPGTTLQLKTGNHASVRAVRGKLQDALKDEYEGSMFLRNFGWFAVGAVISVVGILLAGFLTPMGDGGLVWFATLFSSAWWGVILTVGYATVKGLFKSRGLLSKIKNLMGLIFLVPFVGAGVAMPTFLFLAGEGLTPAMMLFMGLAVLLALFNLIFYWLLRAPTIKGQAVLDQIEGFRLYMTTAEEERLQVLHPPAKTPALFERYLPYAMALDCENEWNAKFAAVLAAAAAAGAATSPAWYSGNKWNSGGFSRDLSQGLTSSISSAATPPGSSSGSSGGGSSGGGGGGGGGSGW